MDHDSTFYTLRFIYPFKQSTWDKIPIYDKSLNGQKKKAGPVAHQELAMTRVRAGGIFKEQYQSE